MNVLNKIQVDALEQATYDEWKVSLEWIREVSENPAKLNVDAPPTNARELGLEGLVRMLFMALPSKAELSLLVIQDLIEQVFRVLFKNDGSLVKIGFWKRAYIGGKAIIAIGKIIKIIVSKK